LLSAGGQPDGCVTICLLLLDEVRL